MLRFHEHAEPEAFLRLLEPHVDQLLGYAEGLVDEHYEADDLLHGALLIALERAREERPPRELIPWLRGVMRNLWARELKQRQRTPDPRRLEARSQRTPEEVVSYRLMLQGLQELSARLPEGQRDVVLLYLEAAYTPQEIAARLGRNASTVRSQLARGLDQLRALIKPSSIGAAVALTVLAADSRARSGAVKTLAPSTGVAPLLIAIVAASIAAVAVLFGPEAPRPRVDPVASALSEEGVAVEAPAGPLALTPPSSQPRTAPVLPASAWSEKRAEARAPTGVTATVREAGGDPVVDLPVRLMWRDGEALDRQRSSLEVRTDERGVASFLLPNEDPFELRYGDDQLTSGPLAVSPGEQLQVEAELEPLFTVRGRVEDDTGRPVAGARVSTSSNYATRWPPYERARTDGEGHYELTSYSRSLAVRAIQRGYVPSSFYRARKGSGENVLTLGSDPTRCAGVVRDRRGDPASDTEVMLYQAAIGTRHTRTDEDGRFAFEAARGTGLLVARAPGDLTWLEGELREDHALTLEPTATIAGSLTQLEEAVSISATPKHFAGRDTLVFLTARMQVESDTGSFILEDVPSGEVHLAWRSQAAPYGTRYLNLLPGERLELTLPCAQPTERIAGEVLDHEGLPVEGVRVLVDCDSLGRQRQRTGPAGRFTFAVPPESSWRLSVLESPPPGMESVQASLRMDAIKAGTEDLRLRLPGPWPGGLRGHLLVERGAPIPQTLRLVDGAGRAGGSLPLAADGSFEARGLRPGRYALLVGTTKVTEVDVGEAVLSVGTLSFAPGNFALGNVAPGPVD